jgi:hypothetical protein
VTLKTATLFCIICFDVDCVKVIGCENVIAFGVVVVPEVNSLKSVPVVGM